MSYLKSPLNYVGGKYKLLDRIIPLMPDNIGTFVDMFCGGCNVAVNIKADRKICNDIEQHVIDFYNGIKDITGVEAKEKIMEVVNTYGLTKENAEGFAKCREDYNENKNWYMFYSVVTHAFNYQIRYNNKGNYNMPFGKNRSCFNPTLQKKFVEFVDNIDSTYEFVNSDFRQLDLSNLNKNDFVYIDSPYLITCAVYNENGGWTEKDEKDLYDVMDKLNEKGIKFMTSNVLENKGRSNDLLNEWAKKYNIHYLDHTYNNCNYQAKDRSQKTLEVIITNY